MLDGRHTGTGGGNHITIGGATPSDSPIITQTRFVAQFDYLLATSSRVYPIYFQVHLSAPPARRHE